MLIFDVVVVVSAVAVAVLGNVAIVVGSKLKPVVLFVVLEVIMVVVVKFWSLLSSGKKSRFV